MSHGTNGGFPAALVRRQRKSPRRSIITPGGGRLGIRIASKRPAEHTTANRIGWAGHDGAKRFEL
jgi:hypothetical protein